MPDPPNLARFLDAQRDTIKAAMNELRAGRKRSHWIWYVFPQLGGLGSSSMAVQFALAGADEARAYLAEPTLHGRYVAAVDVVYEQVVARGTPVETLMGSHIDALKLVSSLTLFAAVAATDPAQRALADRCEAVLAKAAAQGFSRCAHTLASIAPAP